MNMILIFIVIGLYAVWWLNHKDKPSDPSMDPWTLIHIPVHHPIGPPPPPHKRSRFVEVYLPIALCFLLAAAAFISAYSESVAVVSIFLITILSIFLRPRDIDEVYPAAIGAFIIFAFGGLSYPDIMDITHKISGASITIIATIVMAVILESFGLFHWIAAKLIQLSKGSGYRLYWYIQLLCFLMTLFFNNDGSILITTPILVMVLKNLGFKPHEQIPYLLSGALIATGSSAPIGVSNITNLIALNIVHMTLYMHTAMMFIPCTLGLMFMSFVMFNVLKKKLPKKLSTEMYDLEEVFFTKLYHPVKGVNAMNSKQGRTRFMLKILVFVFSIRCLIFVASYFSIPIEIVAVGGSAALLLWRWYYLKTNPVDILKKTPWGILIFAFSMYAIIYGLNNIGLTQQLVVICEPIVKQSLLHASMLMGGLISVLSNIFNNHPALMIGTITLTKMGLDAITLKTIYLANIIGSDIGSLLLPIGTLASLMWIYILKRNAVKVHWKEYISVTIRVIPITVIFTLLILFYWVQTVFA